MNADRAFRVAHVLAVLALLLAGLAGIREAGAPSPEFEPRLAEAVAAPDP
ncbi:MAG: hypothetical protein R6V44_07550 [Paracoccaceae bacterium]